MPGEKVYYTFTKESSLPGCIIILNVYTTNNLKICEAKIRDFKEKY
jgi:hypothetical protein